MPQDSTARLEARLPVNVHAMLKRAAQIQGRTLTDFVVGAAHEAAMRTIEQTEIIQASRRGPEAFLPKLCLSRQNPMRPCCGAFEHHRRLVEQG